MRQLTDTQIGECIHRRQRSRFVLALVAAIVLAPIMAIITVVGTIAYLFFPALILALWLGSEATYAFFIGNTVLVSDLNYPRIHHLTKELRASMRMDKDVSIFVYGSSAFNAYMARIFFKRAIFLNSEVLEAGVSDDEVRWLVGRFIGYWKMQLRTGAAGWLIRVSQRFLLLNWFILPYDRAMTYTGDRLALATINGDLSTAASAMQKLLVGRKLGYSVNPIGIVEQHRQIKGSLFGLLARASVPYPHLTARYVDLIAFTKETFPAPFGRFDSENPGLPSDFKPLVYDGSEGLVVICLGVLLAGGFLTLIAFTNVLLSLVPGG